MGYNIGLVAPPIFLSETLFIFDEDLRTRVAITGGTLAAAGLIIEPTQLTKDETEAYVEFAQFVDDGEAQALAIAFVRGLPLLTDDDAGLKSASARAIQTVTTLELAYDWSKGKSPSEVQAACRRLRLRARYGVPRVHPRADWYRAQLNEID